MECYNCGHELASDAERCPRCGQRFKPRAASQPAPAKPSLLDRLKSKLGKKDGQETESDQP
jgi:predicted amidophosphoribosyltransferase